MTLSATPLLFLSGSATTRPFAGTLTSIVPFGSQAMTRGLPRSEANVDMEMPLARLRGRPVVLVPAGEIGAGAFCVFEVGFAALPPQEPVSYTHLRAHETRHDLVCRLLL